MFLSTTLQKRRVWSAITATVLLCATGYWSMHNRWLGTGQYSANDPRAHFVEKLKQANCADAVTRTLHAWGAGQHPLWKLDTDPLENRALLRAPTEQIGYWAQARFLTEKNVELRLVSSRELKQVIFDPSTCVSIESLKTAPVHAERSDVFSDQDLAEEIAKNPKGLVYVWSPHMPYSVRAYPIVQAVAKKMGLHVITLVDPGASQEFAARTALQSGIPAQGARRAVGVEFALREMTTHYPSLIVYNGGKISNGTYLGIHTAENYEEFIQKRL